MSLPSSTATMTDAQRFADAVQQAGGAVPEALTNLIAGYGLLSVAQPVSDPARAVVAAAADGKLTESKLAELITQAAAQQSAATYTVDLRQRSERLFVDAFHKALQAGAADAVLDSLRPAFDTAAETIADARDLIPASEPAEQFLRTAQPAALTAWQALDTHLTVIDSIAAIAAQFGPRLGNWPLVQEYALGDGFRLEDKALLCTDGILVSDSAAFRRPGSHRASPWYQLALRLHTVASARARYNAWAADEWQKTHASPPASRIDEDGQTHELPRPTNPYRATVSA